VLGCLACAVEPRAEQAAGTTGDPAADSLWAAALAISDDAVAWALIERAVAESPGDAALVHAFRMESRSRGRTERALVWLDSLAAAHPADMVLEAQVALAHLDRLGSPGVDIAGAGVLVNRATRRLDALVERDASAWLPAYALGLCELVWHSKLRHARYAVEHFDHCLRELERSRPRPAEVAQVTLLLGDAQAKARQHAAAIATYERGLRIDPQHAVLQQRVSLERQQILDLTDAIYSLTQAPDTDLALFFGDRPRQTGEH